MTLDLLTVPCRKDNYAFLIHDPDSGATAVVDVPDAAPILAALEGKGWTLTDIFLTHHHGDHIDGVAPLLAKAPALVWGAKADAHRLPKLDHELTEGDTFRFGGQEVRVIDVSGHTMGHIAFYLPEAHLAFTGDSLMAAGCGRVFEGTPAIMWQSLRKLAALPDETLICSGHEYTAANIRFALTLEPNNAALMLRSKAVAEANAKGQPTVPSTLALERDTNPFLRAPNPAFKATLGMSGATDADVFAEIRARKDTF